MQRAFVTQTLDQLAVTIAALDTALQSGQLNELRAAGVMTRTGRIDVERAYKQARYEAYLRAQTLLKSDPAYVKGVSQDDQTGINAQTLALLALYPNPNKEVITHVESRSVRVPSLSSSIVP